MLRRSDVQSSLAVNRHSVSRIEPFDIEPGKPVKGTCRVCGCTQDKACVVEGQPCYWVDGPKSTLCSACCATAVFGAIAKGDRSACSAAVQTIVTLDGGSDHARAILQAAVDYVARLGGGTVNVVWPRGPEGAAVRMTGRLGGARLAAGASAGGSR